MPEIEHRDAKPVVIPRRQAILLIPIQFAIAGFLQWGVSAAHADWWGSLIVWPPLIMAGALIVRAWPLLLLGEK